MRRALSEKDLRSSQIILLVMAMQLEAKQMDDTVLEQLAMEARLRQRSARRRRQVAEQYVEHIVS